MKTATVLELVSLESKDWAEKSKKIKIKIISRSQKRIEPRCKSDSWYLIV